MAITPIMLHVTVAQDRNTTSRTHSTSIQLRHHCAKKHSTVSALKRSLQARHGGKPDFIQLCTLAFVVVGYNRGD
jgi:hypothetical protein